MGKFIDRSGSKHGRLTIISLAQARPKKWLCRCDCGNELVAHWGGIQQGTTASCGCLRRETTRARASTHGLSNKSREYRIWKLMRGRCNNPNTPEFELWGGRGISVCERWSNFEAFLADMGRSPTGTSLDRIDCDGNYEPGNCRWATPKEQSNNKRTNTKITHLGRTQNLKQWSEELGLNYDMLKYRNNQKWPVDKLFGPPLRQGAA